MSRKILLRLGLCFLFFALAVYISTTHWLNSRIFIPLDYPVSLDARQLKSPPFQINLRETYFVSLDLDYSVDDWDDHNRCNYKNILYPQWRLYKLGSHSAQPRKFCISSEQLRDGQGAFCNAVLVSPGRYQLEWDTPVVAPCLNPRHPRLSVSTDSSSYSDAVALIQLFCVFLGGTGLVLTVLPGTAATRHPSGCAAVTRMFPELVLRNVIPLLKHSPLLPIHGLPHWGLFSGGLLWILIFTFMIFLAPRMSHGLLMTLRSHDGIVSGTSPWQETLAVYVRPNGRFFVNDEEVERSSLRPKLLKYLSRRVEWTVYFEGDPDTLYMDDVYAIDTIQDCGAKVIWITPKLREEWQHKEKSAQRIP